MTVEDSNKNPNTEVDDGIDRSHVFVDTRMAQVDDMKEQIRFANLLERCFE